MKISYNWLKEYINTNLTAEEIAKILTDCGLEIESIEKYESVKGGLKGVVIGEVISKEKHPNADKLSCCKVNIGNEVLDIVCGAPNVDKDQKVAVATAGTELYFKDEPLTIKAGKIRGEISNGMICAEDELGLGSSHEGIMVLDSKAKIGTPASDYFKVINDTILEVAITPNRSDAISHIGVARDLAAAINNRETHLPKTTLNKPDVSNFKIKNNNLYIPIEIANPEACARYTGITISGITVKESPEWLANKIKAIGLRPINNIVDITNFVMMELGQPLHAFDADKIKGKKVIVKKLEEGTPFITLDNIERKLHAEDLMICNTEEPMCIAGVFGGAKSGVTNNTKNIFLESAYFDATHVRKTSKGHGLKTDASFRYERGGDPNITIFAIKRAAALIEEMGGGSISSDIVDVYPFPINNKAVALSFENVNRLIGKDIPKETVKNILHDLEIDIIQETENGLSLSIPPFKADVTREADVIEEILRIYGYNNIEISHKLNASLSYSQKPDPEHIRRKISNYLSNNGFFEIMTNSQSSVSYYENSDIFDQQKCVKILNPLSKELEVMRQTLLFSGLESVARNINYKQHNLKFYEFGTVYQYNADASSDNVTKRYTERKKIALFITGKQQPDNWNTVAKNADYFYLKSFILSAFKHIGIDLHLLKNDAPNENLFTQGESFSIHNKNILSLGQLKTKVLKSFDIKQPVYYAEIEWNALLSTLKPDTLKQTEISKFPEVRRDLALLLDKNITFSEIESIANKIGKGILKNINLFDEYKGEKIGSSKKSYAISLLLQDDKKTLTDKEIDKFISQLTYTLEKQLGAEVRK